MNTSGVEGRAALPAGPGSGLVAEGWCVWAAPYRRLRGGSDTWVESLYAAECKQCESDVVVILGVGNVPESQSCWGRMVARAASLLFC